MRQILLVLFYTFLPFVLKAQNIRTMDPNYLFSVLMVISFALIIGVWLLAWWRRKRNKKPKN